jgi:hypothetical protein
MAEEQRNEKPEPSQPNFVGAPPQEGTPEGRSRGLKLGTLADIAGFVGAFLIVVGAVWLRMRPGERTLAYEIAGTGAAVFLFYGGYYLSRWLKDPRWSELTHIVLYSVVVLVILGGLNFVAYRNKKEWDLTAEKVHTLSAETLSALKQARDDIKIVLFVQGTDPAKERLHTLVKRYTDNSPRIKAEVIDPIREPLKAIQYGLSGTGTSVFVEQGDRRIAAATTDEQGITNAVLRILKPPQIVCFTGGHNEKDPKTTDESGYSDIARFFSDKNYQVQTMSLLQEGKVPENCGALVIAGPETTFLAPEVQALQDYLAKDDARLLIAMDPLANPGLDGILKKWGITVNSHLFIVDPELKLESATNILLAGAGIGFSQESDITKAFGNEGMVFPLSTPVLLSGSAPASAKITTILKSMPSSWAQSDKSRLGYQPARGDLRGPLPIGVSIEDGNRRIIILGDSDFASNLVVQNLPNNRDLALNMVRWLVKQEELITLTRKETRSEAMTLSRGAGQFILVYSLLLLPGIFTAFGILVWWRKRGR